MLGSLIKSNCVILATNGRCASPIKTANHIVCQQQRQGYSYVIRILSSRGGGINEQNQTEEKQNWNGNCARINGTRFPAEDHENRIVLHAPVHGYRTKPFTWRELQKICQIEKDYTKLSRSVNQQYQYQLHMRKVKHEYKTINDFILCSKFGFQAQKIEGEDCKVALFNGIGANNMKESLCAVVPNDFPYFVEDDVEHWVLWKIGTSPCTEQEIESAKREIQEKLNPSRIIDTIHWTNPPHLRSFPDFDHVHILCLVQR